MILLVIVSSGELVDMELVDIFSRESGGGLEPVGLSGALVVIEDHACEAEVLSLPGESQCFALEFDAV